jgi:phosphatidylglycerophosphate synthase
MAVSTDSASRRPLELPERRRPAPELVLVAVFQPLASLVARALLPLRVPPPAVVLAAASVGLAAAVALERRTLVLAALLLQVKTVLDNADGQLARLSGRVTLLGRYLDTEADLAVNAALFAALGSSTGEPWLALAAFCALTLVLTVDFNVGELYRELHGETSPTPPAAGSRIENALAWIYGAVFAPQDRLVRTISSRRLERVLGGVDDQARRDAAASAYHGRLTLTVLANLGLSTQLAALGLCLAVGAPSVYLWLVVACAGSLPLLQLQRERRARRALGR